MDSDYSDAALVLLGHGTDLNPGSATPVKQHVAELRRRRIFASVHEAFWKQEPQVKQVLAGLKVKRVLLVPLFVSEGYFSSEVIPRELGISDAGILRTAEGSIFYCKPIGTHPRMTEVILGRAAEVVKQFPFPRAPKPKEITLIIAGHGTERSAESRKSIEHEVELIRAQSLYAGVHALFLDEEPRIPKCFELAQTRNLVVVPFFASNGLHVTEDIPVLLGEPERIVKQRLVAGQSTWRNPTERKDKLVWYTEAVGTSPLVAEVILERVREMAGSSTKEV